MLLRALTTDDLPAIAALDAELFFEPWPLSSLQRHLERGLFAFGAFSGDTLCGYLLGCWIAGEAELLQLGVAADHQRHGVGRRLLTAFLMALKAQQVEAVFLEVRQSALAAQGLYQTAGFKPVGRRARYYKTASGDEDALLMRLALS